MSQIKEGFNYVNPEETGSYIEYLKLKYKTIEVLNEECKTDYESFDALDNDRPESTEYEKLGKNHLLWSVIRNEKYDNDHKHWNNIRNRSHDRNKEVDTEEYFCKDQDEVINEVLDEDFYKDKGENVHVYVVTSNDKPIFHTKNREDARLKMRKMAKILKADYISDYTCNISYKTLDSIQIIGNYKWYIMSYDNVLERLGVKLVPHC